MAYYAIVTKLTNLHKDENSNTLYLANAVGDGVVVDNGFTEDELVLYFPTDGKMKHSFGDSFTLFRKNEDGTKQGGYLEDSGHIKAIKLRGNRSSGIVLHVSNIYEKFGDQGWKENDLVDSVNGIKICEKYVPPIKSYNGQRRTSVKGKRVERVVYPDFEMHKDTEQLIYHYNDFKVGDRIQMTLKMHGTSQRSGIFDAVYPKGFFRRLFHLPAKHKLQEVCGTRRTVIDLKGTKPGFYGTEEFRIKMHKLIAPYLEPGMEVFYEIVGYYDNHDGAYIMPPANNNKLNDPDFVREFGEVTRFTYGCSVGECKPYIYRITSNYGKREWLPAEIKMWCVENDLNYVPEVCEFDFVSVDDLNFRIDNYFEDLHDPVGKTHIKEGVVIRVLNYNRWIAYKMKTWEFRCLEALIKDTEVAPDMEEIQEVIEEGE